MDEDIQIQAKHKDNYKDNYKDKDKDNIYFYLHFWLADLKKQKYIFH